LKTVLSSAQHWQIKQASRALKTGGVIAYPTESVYGLGCDPLNQQAVNNILTLKSRPANKGLILVAKDWAQIDGYIGKLSTMAITRLQKSWPGPTTWVVPASTETPPWLCGPNHTIALRITAHPLTRALCEAAGHALISTSANKKGLTPITTALATQLQLGQSIDYILNDTVGDLKRPTVIREAHNGDIIRV